MKINTLWLIIIVISIAGVGVPYLFLGDIPSFAASYIFWTLLTILTIIIGVIHLREWGDN